MHGRTLDVLKQDVRQLRGDTTELRGEMTRRLDALEQAVASILAAVSPRPA
jgi:hypothetical protein